MPNTTSIRLKDNIPQIMDLWEKRALKEVMAAHHQKSLALRNSLPEYLDLLVDALSTTIDRTQARNRKDLADSVRVGKKHGNERANSIEYTMDQMISEYQILRQCICDVLEDTGAPLTIVEREVIVCSIEQAVNDAATQFSETNKEFQEHLAHILVHDLRNPLAAAKVSADLIVRKPNDQIHCIDKAQRILKSIDRIDRMIGELLDNGRTKAAEIAKISFAELDLDALIKEVAEESNLGHNNSLIVKSNGKCMGHWNEDSVRRLIENLTTNAIKYGTPNTQVTLTLEQTSVLATLSVHNEGAPIAQEEQAILFRKFRRSREAEKKPGWGLGLSVVQGVVDAHRGTIRLVSEPGKGTTFIIELPKASPA